MIDRSQPLAAATLLFGLVFAAPSVEAQSLKEIMAFAADMAGSHNWREAKYRWESAARERPDDPKLLNNLGVALEALGDVEAARERYEAAYRQSGGDPQITENLKRFEFFWEQARRGIEGQQAVAPEVEAEGGQPAAPEPELALAEEGKKLKGKTERVSLSLPVPARLELNGNESLLVTSFRVQETDLLDVNRELVRYLRGELRKHTDLRVLDINPPPAIPEQTVEDLLANAEFWRYLGRNYEADLIVSGLLFYDREDASTFMDVDVISNVTGQKVRESRFVEQEQFTFLLDVFFIDGATGSLRFRDRLQRGMIFPGLQNDPITAFFQMTDAIAPDVLAVVTARYMDDTRVIFRR